MSKTSNIMVRLDPELKAQAESVLTQLGIPMSNAINIFLKQVVMQKGMPFDLKLRYPKPKGMASMSEEELNKELEEGYEAYLNEDGEPAEKVFADLRKELGL